MRVALYYPWIYLTSGAERTILELTGRSRHEWTLLTNHYAPESTFPGFEDRRVVRLAPVSVRRSIGAVALAASRILTQRLPLEGHDALVVVCEGLGDLAVFRSRRCPALCICLSPLRAVFDEEYRARARAARGATGRAVLAAGAALFRAVDRLAWQRYAHILCISEECRRRALAGGLADPSRLELLHVGIGVRAEAPRPRFEPFFLIPGRIMWTKNIELGIDAFAQFRRAMPDARFRLVIAGIVDAKSRPYLAGLQARAAATPGIEFRIAPTDRELADLYERCHAVLFPAFNEDWGIVPLEAMSFGKPVVATDRGGPREIVEPGVNGFLEQPTPAAFAARLVGLAGDAELARSLGAAGIVTARRFSWETFAARVDQALEQIVTAPAPVVAPGSGHQPAPGL